MATMTRYNPVWVGSSLNATEPLFKGSAVVPSGSFNQEDPWLIETAGQTFRAGDPVAIDGNGTVALFAVSTTLGIAGFSQLAATGVTGAQTYLRVVRPDDLYVMNVFHTTPASAVTAQTHLGAVFALKVATVTGNGTALWGVDLDAGSSGVEGTNNKAAHVRVVGFPLKSPIGEKCTLSSANNPVGLDVYAPVLVQFLAASFFNTSNAAMLRVCQLA